MAEAAGAAGATPPHRGLPDEIFIWEILVRLPPKSLLSCRSVSRAWRRATSARNFLIAHHARQPTLPLFYVHNRSNYGYFKFGGSLDIIPLDHRAAADHLQSVARLDQESEFWDLKASCDGILVLSWRDKYLGICNPATRQYAPFRLPFGFRFVGMYRHSPTGEYRLLMYLWRILAHQEMLGSKLDCFVLSLGSGQPPRNISPGEAHKLIFDTSSLLFHGRLHWLGRQHEGEIDVIIMFDTTDESFRQMRLPVVRGTTRDMLFDMDGMLAMSSFNDTGRSIDIWVLQDYESEVWAIKCHIELPLTEIRASCGRRDGDNSWQTVVVSGDGELLVLIHFPDWLIQVDMNGKLVATFHRKGVRHTQLQLKQSLVQHAFFPSLEGYVVNDLHFI